VIWKKPRASICPNDPLHFSKGICSMPTLDLLDQPRQPKRASCTGGCAFPNDNCHDRGRECAMAPIIAEEEARGATQARRALAQIDSAIRTLAASRAVLVRVLGDRA
jgi:hypothetical protein